MTPEEIKQNAPDGATHYYCGRNNKTSYYVKHLNLMHMDGVWIKLKYPIDDLHHLKPL